MGTYSKSFAKLANTCILSGLVFILAACVFFLTSFQQQFSLLHNSIYAVISFIAALVGVGFIRYGLSLLRKTER